MWTRIFTARCLLRSSNTISCHFPQYSTLLCFCLPWTQFQFSSGPYFMTLVLSCSPARRGADCERSGERLSSISKLIPIFTTYRCQPPGYPGGRSFLVCVFSLPISIKNQTLEFWIFNFSGVNFWFPAKKWVPWSIIVNSIILINFQEPFYLRPASLKCYHCETTFHHNRVVSLKTPLLLCFSPDLRLHLFPTSAPFSVVIIRCCGLRLAWLLSADQHLQCRGSAYDCLV